MNLAELAYACRIYEWYSTSDRDYRQFLTNVANSPDLAIAEHRLHLVRWLKSWHCFRGVPDYAVTAANEVGAWYDEHMHALPPPTRDLWELTDEEIGAVHEACRKLAQRQAGRNARSVVRIGWVAAAKTLFGLRPRSLMAWDNTIMQGYSYDMFIRTAMQDAEALAERHGLEIGAIPQTIGKPDATVPKLLDEYYWMTKVMNLRIPDSSTLQQWAVWSVIP